MELGQFYEANRKKLESVTDKDWRAAIKKCKIHLQWKLKQKTLSGVHSAANLGAEATDHYMEVAFEKLLGGAWEWKDAYTLGQQLIRIINSEISKEVERAASIKKQSLKIIYADIESEFYDLSDPPSNKEEEVEFEERLKKISDAAAGDEDLEFMIEGLREGKKRAEIAELLGIGVRQLDKLREKLIRRIQNHKP